MVWPRPVPTIGDISSSADRSADPRGWAFLPEDRDTFYSVLAGRRDVRRFRSDRVDPEILRRVLVAAHDAPSVGHSQPWRFIVVRDPAVRAEAASLADQERLAQAAKLDEASGRQLLDLDLQGIREAPLGIVVCCDRRTPASGVLGRATFADADLWSCVCAVENLWLAARAEGLGVGWVTLFRPEDLAALVRLPPGVATVGWLCLGWPDERPPGPGLERRGWSRRQPLEEVVFEDRWPDQDPPPPPPSRLAGAPSRLAGPFTWDPVDASAVVGAHDRADRLLTPPGSLGVLDRVIDRVVSLGHGGRRSGHLVLAAADHPVVSHGVSAYPPSVTRVVVEASVAGVGLGVVAARAAGLVPVIVDAGVDGGPVAGSRAARPREPAGDLLSRDALSLADAHRLVRQGRRLGVEVGAGGVVALGEIGVGNTTVAAALAALLLGLEPSDVVGLGAGADSQIVVTKNAVVRSALIRVRRSRLDPVADPVGALAALGGGELAVLTGVVLGAASTHAVVVLDGLATSVAALVAVLVEPLVAGYLVAGQRSREVGHRRVLDRLGLEPLLDLRIRAGEGAGAALACGVLFDGLAIRQATAKVTPTA